MAGRYLGGRGRQGRYLRRGINTDIRGRQGRQEPNGGGAQIRMYTRLETRMGILERVTHRQLQYFRGETV